MIVKTIHIKPYICSPDDRIWKITEVTADLAADVFQESIQCFHYNGLPSTLAQIFVNGTPRECSCP